jgi:hypothetical protein
LTKGPLALFFGGQEIIPLLSTESAKSSNMLIIILVILSPVLQLLIHFYKKIRFRKEIKYEQQLQQAVMSGVRNAYGPIIIFIGFLGIGVSACVHFHASERNINSPVLKDVTVESTFAPIFWMIIIFSFMIWINFLQNPKLRFERSKHNEIIILYIQKLFKENDWKNVDQHIPNQN